MGARIVDEFCKHPESLTEGIEGVQVVKSDVSDVICDIADISMQSNEWDDTVCADEGAVFADAEAALPHAVSALPLPPFPGASPALPLPPSQDSRTGVVGQVIDLGA